jgi:hypothetical protein
MRIAAGIILIILGIFGLIGLIIVLSEVGINLYTLPIDLLRIVVDAFLVTGGVLCLKRRYWGLCLASALLALSIGIFAVVEPLLHGHLFMTWDTWILVIGAVISTIFISLTKKEWQNSQA